MPAAMPPTAPGETPPEFTVIVTVLGVVVKPDAGVTVVLSILVQSKKRTHRICGELRRNHYTVKSILNRQG